MNRKIKGNMPQKIRESLVSKLCLFIHGKPGSPQKKWVWRERSALESSVMVSTPFKTPFI